ncbi:MAG: hypothetical protein OEU63_05045 [Gammaproteobacteria bacterium]|nr:hypothetical protein [Gammaproteobacteria bacterium]
MKCRQARNGSGVPGNNRYREVVAMLLKCRDSPLETGCPVKHALRNVK